MSDETTYGIPVGVLRDRFWAKVLRQNEESCWLWNASQDKNSYGQFHVGDTRPHKAHRVSWELTYGPIPKGMWVLHRCDNPPCVNPNHLWLGTNSSNIRDAVAKGRWGPSRRADKLARLTDAQVHDIRLSYDAGATQKHLAITYGVGPTTIYRVLHGPYNGRRV